MKKTFIEIERKWLMKNLPNLSPNQIINIVQFYTEEDIRYRGERSSKDNKDFFYKMEKKSIGKGRSRVVVEEISLEEFYQATQNCPYMIKKKRHIYEQENFNIEIDVFWNMSLVLMEIEVNSLEDKLEIPEAINKYIIKEVTGDPHFSNKYLSGFVN